MWAYEKYTLVYIWGDFEIAFILFYNTNSFRHYMIGSFAGVAASKKVTEVYKGKLKIIIYYLISVMA